MNYEVKEITTPYTEAKTLLENHHYKGKYRFESLLAKFVFGLYDNSELIGVLVYGQGCSKRFESKYGSKALELRRLVFSKQIPNLGSYFISRTIRILKSRAVEKVISYADANVGHSGGVYKASNFQYLGKEKYIQYVMKHGGKIVGKRQIYQKNKHGKYYKSALKYQELLKSGKRKYTKLKPKLIFGYDL